MNRLIMSIVFLSSIFSLTAMEHNKISLLVSPRESAEFIGFLDTIVCANKNMISKKYISEKNSLHIIMHKLSNDFVACDKDLSKVIELQGLKDRLFAYEAIEADDFISWYRDKTILDTEVYEDKNNAYKELIKLRYIIAGSMLKHIQPTYCFEVSDQEQVDFMNKNEFYPMDEESQKDYIALIIYQLAIAPRFNVAVTRK